MRDPRIEKIIATMYGILDAKSDDYAQIGNVFSNFEFAAQVAEGFHGTDKVFATLIGIKIARLRNLSNKPDREIRNESTRDTRIDLTNYAALWAAYHERKEDGTTQED